MKKLDFGQFNGDSSFGVTKELKEKVTFKKGPATVAQVDIHEKEGDSEDGEEPSRWRNIALRIKGVEGGGCFDTITTRTPSKFILGLQRVKYLFNAIKDAIMPDIDYLLYAVNGSEDKFTAVIVSALEAYEVGGGSVKQVASINEDGQIIFSSLTAMNEVLGEGHGIDHLYADLGATAKLKFAHEANLRAIGNEDDEETQASRAEAKQAYYASLDAQPAVPCQINEDSLDVLAEALKAIDPESMFEAETKQNNRRQVKAYTVIK